MWKTALAIWGVVSTIAWAAPSESSVRWVVVRTANKRLGHSVAIAAERDEENSAGNSELVVLGADGSLLVRINEDDLLRVVRDAGGPSVMRKSGG